MTLETGSGTHYSLVGGRRRRSSRRRVVALDLGNGRMLGAGKVLRVDERDVSEDFATPHWQARPRAQHGSTRRPSSSRRAGRCAPGPSTTGSRCGGNRRCRAAVTVNERGLRGELPRGAQGHVPSRRELRAEPRVTLAPGHAVVHRRRGAGDGDTADRVPHCPGGEARAVAGRPRRLPGDVPRLPAEQHARARRQVPAACHAGGARRLSGFHRHRDGARRRPRRDGRHAVVSVEGVRRGAPGCRPHGQRHGDAPGAAAGRRRRTSRG